MIIDNLEITGALQISLNNEIVHQCDNLVVTAGKNWVADRMNDANTVMTHMALGTGTNAAAAGDTTLQTEIDRNALTSTTVSTNTIAYACTWAAGDGTGAITEAAILDAASSGDMLARTVFSVVNKGASDSITITWTITIS